MNIRELAEQTARSLGVPLYIRGDKIFQSPPGEKIDPPPGSQPNIWHGNEKPPEKGE